MKPMSDERYRWHVKNFKSMPIILLSTFLSPGRMIQSIYENNRGRAGWWGKKKACFTLSYDCDYPQDAEAIPHNLRLLSKYDIKASFAVVGHWVEKFPNEHLEAVKEGHEILNHTYSHPDNELLNPGRKFLNIPREEKVEEVARCHRTCEDVLKVSPVGCRIPHFKNLFTPDIYGILKELKYTYSSSTYLTNRPTHGDPFVAEGGIIEFPLSTCPAHPYTVFDTWHSLVSSQLFYKLIHSDEKSYQKLFRRLVEIGIETNSYINIYIDPHDVVVMKNFESLLSYLSELKSDIEIATYQDLMPRIQQQGNGASRITSADKWS